MAQRPTPFYGGPIPSRFRVRRVAIAPGATHPYEANEWRDALVVLAQGELELLWDGRDRLRLSSGAVLWLVDLPLRGLRNPGAETALLLAISRRNRG